jgi:single-strand DNA-binding protein
MRSLNRVQLIGNMGRDPEMRYTTSGKAVCNFSVATSHTWKDPDGTPQERTEWHNIVAWGKLGEICNQYLAKGRQVFLEGRLQTRKWQGQDGSDRYTTEVVIDNMILLGGGRNEGGAPGRQPAEAHHERTPHNGGSGGAMDDDDIPF